MSSRPLSWLFVFMLAIPVPALAQSRPARNRAVSTLTTRRRAHAQKHTTNPGTLEIEFSAAGSRNGFVSPFTLKYTPGEGGAFLRRTEFSLDFESVSSLPGDLYWVTQFGDFVGITTTHLLHQDKIFTVFFAPQVAFLVRGNSGLRAGATTAINAEIRNYSYSANITWTAATSPTGANPAGDLQSGAGVVRRFGGTKDLPRWTLFANLLHENPTLGQSSYSFFEGFSRQLTKHVAFDFALRHLALRTPGADHQVLAGFTINLGRPRDW